VRRLAVVAVCVAAFAASSCTRNDAAAFFAARELGADETRPEPYMTSSGFEDHPNPAVRQASVGFWCDEFAAAMLNRAGIHPNTTGEPQGLAEQYPIAEAPYRPGDLVFVTYNPARVEQRYDHVGILQRADGDHLWVVDGNWPTGRYKPNGRALSGVVLNERWVGDGSVTEIRRP
jgi:hypothetical protein